MDSSSVIVFVVILIILVASVVMVVNYFIPFFKKIEVQNIGQEYFNIMEVNSGLTVSERDEIVTTLTNKGFQNISVTYTQKGAAVHGQSLKLEIDTEYVIKKFILFSSSNQVANIDFASEILSRRVED
ncbi:MAG: hypothetical protein JEZ08_16570 [Clostridiales bacterium]|nr:hypothetical protein [Clostridiales bacterium]